MVNATCNVNTDQQRYETKSSTSNDSGYISEGSSGCHSSSNDSVTISCSNAASSSTCNTSTTASNTSTTNNTSASTSNSRSSCHDDDSNESYHSTENNRNTNENTYAHDNGNHGESNNGSSHNYDLDYHAGNNNGSSHSGDHDGYTSVGSYNDNNYNSSGSSHYWDATDIWTDARGAKIDIAGTTTLSSMSSDILTGTSDQTVTKINTTSGVFSDGIVKQVRNSDGSEVKGVYSKKGKDGKDELIVTKEAGDKDVDKALLKKAFGENVDSTKVTVKVDQENVVKGQPSGSVHVSADVAKVVVDKDNDSTVTGKADSVIVKQDVDVSASGWNLKSDAKVQTVSSDIEGVGTQGLVEGNRNSIRTKDMHTSTDTTDDASAVQLGTGHGDGVKAKTKATLDEYNEANSSSEGGKPGIKATIVDIDGLKQKAKGQAYGVEATSLTKSNEGSGAVLLQEAAQKSAEVTGTDSETAAKTGNDISGVVTTATEDVSLKSFKSSSVIASRLSTLSMELSKHMVGDRLQKDKDQAFTDSDIGEIVTEISNSDVAKQEGFTGNDFMNQVADELGKPVKDITLSDLRTYSSQVAIKKPT